MIHPGLLLLSSWGRHGGAQTIILVGPSTWSRDFQSTDGAARVDMDGAAGVPTSNSEETRARPSAWWGMCSAVGPWQRYGRPLLQALHQIVLCVATSALIAGERHPRVPGGLCVHRHGLAPFDWWPWLWCLGGTLVMRHRDKHQALHVCTVQRHVR